MPVFSRHWQDPTTGQRDPGRLQLDGPCLHVEIGLPRALSAALQAAGQALPTPQVGVGLIDTGASATAVDEGLLLALGLAPTGATPIATPSGATQQALYACEIAFPGTPIPALDLSVVIGSVLAPQGIVALIGRDLLRHFLLVYNGPEGEWTLAF